MAMEKQTEKQPYAAAAAAAASSSSSSGASSSSSVVPAMADMPPADASPIQPPPRPPMTRDESAEIVNRWIAGEQIQDVVEGDFYGASPDVLRRRYPPASTCIGWRQHVWLFLGEKKYFAPKASGQSWARMPDRSVATGGHWRSHKSKQSHKFDHGRASRKSFKFNLGDGSKTPWLVEEFIRALDEEETGKRHVPALYRLFLAPRATRDELREIYGEDDVPVGPVGERRPERAVNPSDILDAIRALPPGPSVRLPQGAPPPPHLAHQPQGTPPSLPPGLLNYHGLHLEAEPPGNVVGQYEQQGQFLEALPPAQNEHEGQLWDALPPAGVHGQYEQEGQLWEMPPGNVVGQYEQQGQFMEALPPAQNEQEGQLWDWDLYGEHDVPVGPEGETRPERAVEPPDCSDVVAALLPSGSARPSLGHQPQDAPPPLPPLAPPGLVNYHGLHLEDAHAPPGNVVGQYDQQGQFFEPQPPAQYEQQVQFFEAQPPAQYEQQGQLWDWEALPPAGVHGQYEQQGQSWEMPPSAGVHDQYEQLRQFLEAPLPAEVFGQYEQQGQSWEMPPPAGVHGQYEQQGQSWEMPPPAGVHGQYEQQGQFFEVPPPAGVHDQYEQQGQFLEETPPTGVHCQYEQQRQFLEAPLPAEVLGQYEQQGQFLGTAPPWAGVHCQYDGQQGQFMEAPPPTDVLGQYEQQEQLGSRRLAPVTPPPSPSPPPPSPPEVLGEIPADDLNIHMDDFFAADQREAGGGN